VFTLNIKVHEGLRPGSLQLYAPRALPPNVRGNRRADETLAEDQSVCRRVRL